jgi:DNA-3-methyladenine glycosylase II
MLNDPARLCRNQVGLSQWSDDCDTPAMMPVTLDEQMLAHGVSELIAADPDLAAVYAQLGLPPLWAREPGFPTLVHIILEQQVSLASALAAFDKLRVAVDPLTPAGVLALDDETLKRIGFSRQKSAYVRSLATAILSGRLDVDALAALTDEQVRTELLALKGIGPWSAEIYLLMALCRADAWPAGDLALQVAAQAIKGLPTRPDPAALNELAERWRPWRAVAARLLWHHYLSKPTAAWRGQKSSP